MWQGSAATRSCVTCVRRQHWSQLSLSVTCGGHIHRRHKTESARGLSPGCNAPCRATLKRASIPTCQVSIIQRPDALLPHDLAPSEQCFVQVELVLHGPIEAWKSCFVQCGDMSFCHNQIDRIEADEVARRHRILVDRRYTQAVTASN